MLAAYLDESYDSGKSGYYVVGGVLGDGWRILRATRCWQNLLAKHGLKKFKLASMSRRPSLVPEFAAIIRDSKLFAFGLIAKQASVSSYLSGAVLHKQYKESPYMLMYHMTFVRVAMKLKKLGATSRVSFICDENARYLSILARSYSELKVLNPNAATYMGTCSVETDEKCVSLQMADLIVGEIRRKAPTWQPDDQSFSSSLQLLLEAETLGWVSLLDDNTLSSIGTMVDKRVT